MQVTLKDETVYTKNCNSRQMYDYTKLLAISDKGTKYVDEFM